MIRWLLPVAVVAAIGAGAAMAATSATHSSTAAVKAVSSAKFGMVLVGANGHTLYRYTPDSKGVNRCTSVPACAKFWPRLLVKSSVKPAAGTGVKASLLGTIKATSTMRQVTYGGFPLYTFTGDKAADQANGEGFEKTWYVVNTNGALVKHAVASPAPPTSGTTTTTSSGSAWG